MVRHDLMRRLKGMGREGREEGEGKDLPCSQRYAPVVIKVSMK